MIKAWIILAVAIVAEVAASSTLLKTEQFTRVIPSILTVILYIIALYGLSISVRYIPLGIAYSVWAGLGIVLTALISVVALGQSLDLPAILGMALIILGVIMINFVSGSVSH